MQLARDRTSWRPGRIGDVCGLQPSAIRLRRPVFAQADKDHLGDHEDAIAGHCISDVASQGDGGVPEFGLLNQRMSPLCSGARQAEPTCFRP